MKKIMTFAVSALLLSACRAGPSNEQASVLDLGAEPTVLGTDLLDQSYTSQRLGISVRYPSTVYNSECDQDIPVVVKETNIAIEFEQEWTLGENCTKLEASRLAEIYASRAQSQPEIQNFVDLVFEYQCQIHEVEEYEQDDTKFATLFVETRNPVEGEPDFACGEAVRWNQTAGVVYFSPLGSKNGGGIDWPSRQIEIAEGEMLNGYDFVIMDSIQFLPSF